jgi:hypothetical protein
MSLVPLPATAAQTAGSRAETTAARTAGARSWLLAAVSLVMAVNMMSSRYLLADTYYDLYAGRYIARHGIPHENVFTSVAHGAHWMDQQWLAQILYYGAWAAGGYRALTALSAALVTSGFAVLAVAMLRRGVPPTRMFAWTLVALLACLGNTGIRAQSFAYPCLALTLWLILEDDRGSRLRTRTWLVIPVLVLWANTHGSVLLGAALVVLYAGYRSVRALIGRDRRAIPAYLALATAATAAVACTPYGTGVIWYYGRTAANPVFSRYIAEWAPPTPLDRLSWGFFALVTATAVAVVTSWRRGARPDPLLFGLACFLLALALTGARFQAWFAFGGSLLAADTLARASGGQVTVVSHRFQQATAAALALLALASLLALATTPTRQFESTIPVKAIDEAAVLAARQPATHVLGDDMSAAPMLWLHPAMSGRVGFDPRMEQYTDGEISAYFDFLEIRGPGWRRVMPGYGIVVVASRHNPQLASLLAATAGWQVVYRDHGGLVLERQARR